MNDAPFASLPFDVIASGDLRTPYPACGVDQLARATEWHAANLRQYAGRPVVYSRGAQSVGVCATVGRTRMLFADELGATVVEYTDRDYLITADALRFTTTGPAELPQRGDVIRERVGSKTLTYEVMGPGGEPPWRFADPYRVMLRIHTKQVDGGAALWPGSLPSPTL
jgi:hypothetical protein